MVTGLTAEVAVSVPLCRTFTYRIPPELTGVCRVGVRVVVPFGPGRKPGVVVAMMPPDHTALKLRPLSEVLDPSPVLDATLLDFTRWVADYYFSPWGQVIEAALPATLLSRRARRVALTESGRRILEDPFAEVRPAERAILDLLARKGALPETRLRQLVRRSPSKLCKALSVRGWIRVLDRSGFTQREDRSEEWVRFRPGSSPVGSLPKGKKQQRILAALTTGSGPVRTVELLRICGASRASLHSLARQGWVVLDTRAVERAPEVSATDPVISAPELTTPQRRAAEAVMDSLEEGGFRTFLLEGVTGSGKTEVYLAAAAAALARGLGVLYLVPEIGLTPLLARRLSARFPGQVAMLHSGLPERERRDQWRRIREGKASLILGTRSALFSPHPRIGLVVVDEEQDSSYFQTESPRYNARDAALVRAQWLKATVILGSATPSVEAVDAVQRGKFRLLSLPYRVEARPMPEVRLIDMREEFKATGLQRLLSRDLIAAIRETHASGGQSLLLLNRRGFATFLMCRACGNILNCSRCHVALTYHRTEERLQCHYCNAHRHLPAVCPVCRSPHLHLGGAGTERLEEAIRIVDPSLRIARMDRDTVRGRGHAAVLERFERREIDLLLGTQMVAKGHDFPGVTLVGVLSADAYLGLPDFRAAERTYQIITQVAGRAGRGNRPGRVLVQAFATQHYALQAAASGEPARFYEHELRLRRLMHYPPYVALTRVLVKDRNPRRGEAHARCVADRLRSSSEGRFRVLGPSRSPLSRLRGESRYQVLLKGRKRADLASGVREALVFMERSGELPRNLVVETDPKTLL